MLVIVLSCVTLSTNVMQDGNSRPPRYFLWVGAAAMWPAGGGQVTGSGKDGSHRRLHQRLRHQQECGESADGQSHPRRLAEALRASIDELGTMAVLLIDLKDPLRRVRGDCVGCGKPGKRARSGRCAGCHGKQRGGAASFRRFDRTGAWRDTAEAHRPGPATEELA